MSLESLCTGDTIQIVTVTAGSFGAAPTITVSDTEYDCRIDRSGGSSDRRAGRADQTEGITAYFLTEPPLQSGKFIKWTSTGGVEFDNPIYLKVDARPYHESKPGRPPRYWVVTAREISALELGGRV